MKRHSRLSHWFDTTVTEMKKYIAIVINMGMIRKKNIEHYWDTSYSQRTPFFNLTMGRNRFQSVSTMFHLSNLPHVESGQPGYDPWYKIRVFLNIMNDSYQQYFIPKQNITIEESMISMKKGCLFIENMQNKRNCYGLKKFEVCDSDTNYILHVELYNGKDCNNCFTEIVVLELMSKSGLLNKGYHLFIGNFCVKFPLCLTLLERNTFLTGMMNKNIKNVFQNVLKTQLEPQQSVYLRNNDVLICGYKQKKTWKPVYFITTGYHAEDTVVRSKSGLEATKPIIINKYNQFVGKVDAKSNYHLSSARQTRRYWVKIFYNLLDTAIMNAFILYSKNTDKPLERHDFIRSIIEDLVRDETDSVSQPGPSGDDELAEEHKLEHLPERRQRMCSVCKSKGRTSFWCPGCNTGVHKECFHKLDHHWRPTHAGKKRK